VTEALAHESAQPDQTDRPPFDLPTKLLYGLGAMGAPIKGRVTGFLLIFYSQIIGLPAPLVSAAIAISILVDAFWDPIVGQLSDNTHTRWGRRHPYIYGAALPAAVCFALLFMPPAALGNGPLFLYLLVLLLAMRAFDSLGDIPAAALMPELTRNYDERTTVQSYRYLFSTVIGGLVGTVLAFGVFLRGTRANGGFGQLDQSGYAPFAITAAIIGVIVVVISAAATQRFIPYMHRPPRQRASFAQLVAVMGAAIGNRNFVSIAVSGLIFGIAVGISGGLGTYFYTYIFELGSRQLLLMGLTAIPAALAGVVIAPFLSRAMDKKSACLTTFFIAIASTTVPLGAWLLGFMPPHAPWVLPVLIIDSMVTAALATTGFIIVSSMTADVVDQNEVRTGRRTEGLLFAAESLLRKFTTSFAALLPGIFLGLVHFPLKARPGQVDIEVLRHLAFIYLPVYTLLTLCSTSALMLYRIDRGQHEATLRTIDDAAVLSAATVADLELNEGPAAVPGAL
jgi:glycoside/pentoside/hexuronide:cation symporter, GPH family